MISSSVMPRRVDLMVGADCEVRASVQARVLARCVSSGAPSVQRGARLARQIVSRIGAAATVTATDAATVTATDAVTASAAATGADSTKKYAAGRTRRSHRPRRDVRGQA
jgi:hypothetical protein